MSKSRPYHIPHKGATIATYWLLQWVGLVLVVAGITVVTGDWTLLVYEIVSFVIMGTVWAAVLMTAQTLYVLSADGIGGRREISKITTCLSITASVLCATGHCALVMWLVIALLAAASDGSASGPLAFLGWTGMIGLLVIWTIIVRTFIREGRREQRYAQLAKGLVVGAVLCGTVCGAAAFMVAIIAGDALGFYWIAAVTAPWPFSAAIALIGCLLYLKRLWTFRAPWYETHCAECGYDLAGNLTVTQCSECGTPWKHPQVSTPASAGTAQNE